MMERQGFVSNSSSSSFIFLLHHKPRNIEDCLQQFWNISLKEAITTHFTYEYSDGIVVHAIEAADMIMDQINKNKQTKTQKIEAIQDFVQSEFYIHDPKRPFIPFNKLMTYMSPNEIQDTERSSRNYSEAYETYSKYDSKLRKIYSKNNPIATDNEYDKLMDYMNKNKKRKELSSKYHQSQKEYNNKCKEVATNLLKTWNDKYVAILSFSDGNGTKEAIMEYGSAFNSVKHIKISRH